MTDDAAGEKPRHRPLTIFAGGCLAVLYLIFCAVVAVLVRQQSILKIAPSPTIPATAAITPQIIIHRPTHQQEVRHEDFSSDIRNWWLYFYPGKLELIDGKLILQSYSEGGMVIGTRTGFFAPVTERYYVQVDLTTDAPAVLPYGLVFGLNESLGTFYLFEVSPKDEKVALLKYNSGQWDMLVPITSASLSPYPEATTLSIYFDEGKIELYTNGELVTTYSDPNLLRSRGVGVLTTGSGYRLIVDDFFVYDEK